MQLLVSVLLDVVSSIRNDLRLDFVLRALSMVEVGERTSVLLGWIGGLHPRGLRLHAQILILVRALLQLAAWGTGWQRYRKLLLILSVALHSLSGLNLLVLCDLPLLPKLDAFLLCEFQGFLIGRTPVVVMKRILVLHHFEADPDFVLGALSDSEV